VFLAVNCSLILAQQELLGLGLFTVIFLQSSKLECFSLSTGLILAKQELLPLGLFTVIFL
jgi:hypothetical protein